MKSRRPKGRRLHWRAEDEANATLCGSWGAPHLAPTPDRVSCLSCRRSLDAYNNSTNGTAAGGNPAAAVSEAGTLAERTVAQ